MKGVGFEYEPGQPVLRDVDLSLPAGVNVAIVGETGSGKTTLAKLLSRLADPTSGTILIGGVPLADVSRRRARRRSGWSPRTASSSRRRSPRTCSSGAPAPPTPRSREAFRALGLDWWVDGLPDGLGDRRRRAGRRAVGRRASARRPGPGAARRPGAAHPRRGDQRGRPGDRAGARRWRSPGWPRGARRCRIAHRLSTAEAADLVVVFDAGRIVQLGTARRARRRGRRVRPPLRVVGRQHPCRLSESPVGTAAMVRALDRIRT